jgi:hypothetical protein
VTRIVSNLYAQENLRRLKKRHEAGETLFLEGTRRNLLQSIFEVSRVRFWYHTHMTTHIFMEIQELKLEGVVLPGYIDLGDFLWREDATESKKVRPKDRVSPEFMDKLGQLVEKGDLLVASNRDGSLEIGQFDRVTHKGTVFLRRVDSKEEFKLYQMASAGEKNTGLLKLTRDLRDQIMLLKLAS